MNRPIPTEATEAAAAGHAVLYAGAAGRFLIPANLVGPWWQEHLSQDPTAEVIAAAPFGEFFTPAVTPATLDPAVRRRLREQTCTVGLADGSTVTYPLPEKE